MTIPMVRHIIIAAYYFPPLGLAGTARPLAMANFFAEKGFPVSVLTVKDIDYPVHDESALADIHPDVKIFRAGSADPARIQRVISLLPPLRKLKGLIGPMLPQIIFPDSKLGFIKPATKLLSHLLKDDARDILITTSPPVSIHQLGLNIAKQCYIKWVADFRDVWGSLPYEDQSPGLKVKAENYLREIANAADLITATSPTTIERFRSRLKSDGSYYFLPNGYSEADFTQPVASSSGCIGLYGTLNQLIGVEKLFDWMNGLRKSAPDTDIKIRHTGFLDLDGLNDLTQKYSLERAFHSVGYLPHHESVQDIRRNVANIIMLTDQCDTSYIIPSKLFELLRAEPPVIAILPRDNAARRLLEEHRFADVSIVDSEQEFGNAVNEAYARARLVGTPLLGKGVEAFDRHHQLSDFSQQLERL